ncbi:hypothetical protein B1813_08045 [Saccharomonospora piscinae]|uniref:SCP1.201-like deaminase n=1 Tax=Saccharomonospora piscinae TaxID=687388 RepID=A0A1V9A567_SACPI|nr:DddA-like double-stranded DNA deaminase toxin [Saccharomonospora piscinae]OQO92190.1 hypothetical protein B1813_08045 [Saccharomonospora piscinae]TLW92123.1 hypothetical protein FFT09_14700 [Saccharomonospora piscinae]
MSAIEHLAKALGDVLARLGEATQHLETARVTVQESRANLAVLDGTSDGEAQRALAQHGMVPDQVEQVQGLLDRCAEQVRTYGLSVGAISAPASRTRPRYPAAEPDSHARSVPPRPPRPGKTHGRWIDGDGNAVVLESGRGGEYYAATRTRAVNLGLARGIPHAEPAIARHVETQFVSRMIDQDLPHAEIEINRPVCGTTPKDRQWMETCHRQLPRFLPAGWTLTVKDGTSPTGRTYVGREVEE